MCRRGGNRRHARARKKLSSTELLSPNVPTASVSPATVHVVGMFYPGRPAGMADQPYVRYSDV
jgi:hypothetical protein